MCMSVLIGGDGLARDRAYSHTQNFVILGLHCSCYSAMRVNAFRAFHFSLEPLKTNYGRLLDHKCFAYYPSFMLPTILTASRISTERLSALQGCRCDRPFDTYQPCRLTVPARIGSTALHQSPGNLDFDGIQGLRVTVSCIGQAKRQTLCILHNVDACQAGMMANTGTLLQRNGTT
jgi:hypothetical protein